MNIIETKRLFLRTWLEKDFSSLYALNQDERVMEHFPSLIDEEDSRSFFQRLQNNYETYGYTLYAVEEKFSKECIGFVGLNYTTFPAHFTPAVEIGWRLSFNYWGKGYATEAAKAVLNYAFTHLDLNEIVSFTIPKNQKSRRVMEKIGMHHKPEEDFFRKDLPKEFQKHVLYRLTKDKYFEQQRPL